MSLLDLINSRSDGGYITINRIKTLMLGANDYLGLSTNPKVLSAIVESLREYGTGLAIYPVFVTSELHQILEQELARFLGVEEVMLTSSGSTANSCVLTSLAVKGDIIISDSQNHASIIDASRQSKAEVVVYKSRNISHLANVMSTHAEARKMVVVTDGVFSMDGGIAPLRDIALHCKKHNALLVIDEAHATAVVGRMGIGSNSHFGFSNNDPSVVLTGSLSKALGGAGGGFVAGTRETITTLRGKSRSHIFTQGMTTASIAAALAALRIHIERPGLLNKLRSNVSVIKDTAKELGLDLQHSDSAILAVAIGDEDLARRVVAILREQNVFVQAITFPIVAKGAARLRLQPSAAHNPEDLRAAVLAMHLALKVEGHA